MSLPTPIGVPRRSRGRWRSRWLPRPVTVVLWLVVGVMVVVAGIRIFAWDALEPFAVLNDLTAFVYLPAWIVAAVAVVWWRPTLAAAALVVVVCQVVFMLPELTAAQPAPAWARQAPKIRLLDANIYSENRSMTGYAAQIKAVQPDLLTMEEAVPRDVRQLTDDGALARFPHIVKIKRWDPFAFLIASRYPLTGVHVVPFDGRPLIVEVTVHLPSGPVSLWVVHTIAPLPSTFSTWKGQLARIDQALEVRGTKGLLLVGDFNATWGSKGFRTILDAGLTDGAAARGQAMDMTWTQMMPPLPPFVRIDHVLTGPGVAVTAIRTGPGPGSDHRDEVATVTFRQ